MIDIITTAYNEEENIELFVNQIHDLFSKLNLDYRIICVNDGSKDNTENIILDLQSKFPIKYIKLSRNFGKDIALSAALDHANGDANIIIDSDLQDPIYVIEEFIQEWNNGYEVVYGIRRSREGESFFKKITAKYFYKTINSISEVDIPKDVGDFRLISKKVLLEVQKMKEKTRFMKGIFAWVGFKSKGVYFDRAPRNAGETSWNYFKLWNFALSGIAAFSNVPLKIWSYLGFFISIISFLYIIFIVSKTLIFGIDLPGYTSTLVIILFFGGIQLISIGVIGEYISRIYSEVKDRPLYVIDYIKDADHE